MIITSPSFDTNEKIPKRYTCDGENVSPPIEFFDVPDDADSLIIIMQDPDAKSGTFTHWTLWNIDARLAGIGEGNIAEGSVEGITTAGKEGYIGPCPPSGTHRYIFRLYAISGKLEIPSSTRPDQLEEEIRGRTVDYAEMMGTYSRES